MMRGDGKEGNEQVRPPFWTYAMIQWEEIGAVWIGIIK